MSDEPTPGHPKVFAIVLAAGLASRFGDTKQLALVDGEPLVHRAARVAREACGEQSVLVVGHDADRVVDAAADQCQFLTVNDHYRDGLGTSIALAARAMTGIADALLLTLADQPKVTAAHLRELVDTWSGADDEIVATAYDNTRGVPALFPSTSFTALSKLHGDTGARQLLNDAAYVQKSVAFEDAGIDIDRPEDIPAS